LQTSHQKHIGIGQLCDVLSDSAHWVWWMRELEENPYIVLVLIALAIKVMPYCPGSLGQEHMSGNPTSANPSVSTTQILFGSAIHIVKDLFLTWENNCG
jgi:hypothetical protein